MSTYIISKAYRDLDDFSVAFAEVEKALRLPKGLSRRAGALGLAGTMALGGGAGAVKAAPALKHLGGGVVDSAKYRAGGAAGSKFWNASPNNTWAKTKTGRTYSPEMARKEGALPAYTKDEWKAAGRPGQTRGHAGFWRSDKPNAPGRQTFIMAGSPGKPPVVRQTLTRNTGRGD